MRPIEVISHVSPADEVKPLEEVHLLESISRGEESATRRLIDEHFDCLYRFLRQLTRQSDEAEDLAQQTLIRVVQNASRFDGRTSLRSWMYAIAYREFGRWRRRRLWLPIPDQLPSSHDTEQQVTDGELLLQALAKLSSAHRAAFLLHHVEGLSIEEVAAAQLTKPGTIKSRLHFARAHLRSTLEQEKFYVAEPTQS